MGRDYEEDSDPSFAGQLKVIFVCVIIYFLIRIRKE
jgi:hypothetical protein